MENHYLWAYYFPMKKGEFDNEYYFYENGKILHVYDKSKTKVNIEEFVSASDIPEHERQQIINACIIKTCKFYQYCCWYIIFACFIF